MFYRNHRGEERKKRKYDGRKEYLIKAVQKRWKK
jgi:hypothetical protein